MLRRIPLHRIPSMKKFEERTRKLVCGWSFILDKRAAGDAQGFKASIDVQAFEAYLDMVSEALERSIARHS
eukprot:2217244-Prorocentrum_lima.AAC.1